MFKPFQLVWDANRRVFAQVVSGPSDDGWYTLTLFLGERVEEYSTPDRNLRALTVLELKGQW